MIATTKKSGAVKPASKSELANFISAQIDICQYSQKEISEMLGYAKPNIITMFKQGITKVPIDKVGPFAEALGVDPVKMLRMAMLEYMPGTWDAIQDVIGYAVTRNEREIVDLYRDETNDVDPRIRTEVDRDRLRGAFKKLV